MFWLARSQPLWLMLIFFGQSEWQETDDPLCVNWIELTHSFLDKLPLNELNEEKNYDSFMNRKNDVDDACWNIQPVITVGQRLLFIPHNMDAVARWTEQIQSCSSTPQTDLSIWPQWRPQTAELIELIRADRNNQFSIISISLWEKVTGICCLFTLSPSSVGCRLHQSRSRTHGLSKLPENREEAGG